MLKRIIFAIFVSAILWVSPVLAHDYMVTGRNHVGLPVAGEVTTSGSTGTGYIMLNGSQINITITWMDVSETHMTAVDNNGNSYQLTATLIP